LSSIRFFFFLPIFLFLTASSILSARVDLPWSIWAIIEKFLIFSNGVEFDISSIIPYTKSLINRGKGHKNSSRKISKEKSLVQNILGKEFGLYFQCKDKDWYLMWVQVESPVNGVFHQNLSVDMNFVQPLKKF